MLDLGAGVGGPAPVAYAPSQCSSSSSSNRSRHNQVKRSQSTRTPASAPQVVYANENPYQTYQCVARSSPSPPSLSTAQDQGYGTNPRQEEGPDDSSPKRSLITGLARNSLDQSSPGGGDKNKQGLSRRILECDYDSLGSPYSTDVRVNPDERIEQEVASSGKVEMADVGEDSAGVCTKTTSHDNRHQGQQDQGHVHGQRLSKAPQHILHDLERALPPLPDPETAAELVPNPTTADDSKKRFSLNSLTSRSTFNKRPDSGMESSTTKRRTPSVKGKDVDRGSSSIQPNAPSGISPNIRQFDLDVDKYMNDNVILDLETHPYRISLEHDLRVQARAYARGLAEERESIQEEAAPAEQTKEGTAAAVVAIAPMISMGLMSDKPPPQSHSIQSKGSQSRSIPPMSSSPHTQAATTPEAKRLSNASRGSARRIIYSADLEQGLPKGHIARESNYEIVPTKRLSASSARTHNTSSKSRGYTTHIVTTADNLDGVPGGPALAAATLIIRPDNRGRSARVIATVNRQDPSNAARQSLGSGTIKSAGLTDSEERVSQQFMSTRGNQVRAVDIYIPSFVANNEREDVVDVGADRTTSESSDGQLNPASSAPKAVAAAVVPLVILVLDSTGSDEVAGYGSGQDRLVTTTTTGGKHHDHCEPFWSNFICLCGHRPCRLAKVVVQDALSSSIRR
ncbi:hypothetical protein BGW39_008919 [Mortierella sp. 14UC]|nr:hypothetical protein BGW39_008919 [Mortierella sp. 14UC]